MQERGRTVSSEERSPLLSADHTVTIGDEPCAEKTEIFGLSEEEKETQVIMTSLKEQEALLDEYHNLLLGQEAFLDYMYDYGDCLYPKPICRTVKGGVLSVVGGCIFMVGGNYFDPGHGNMYTYIGLGTIFTGIFTVGCCSAVTSFPCIRPYTLNQINKPITLPDNFKIADFNKLLESLSFPPVTINIAPDVVKASEIMQEAKKDIREQMKQGPRALLAKVTLENLTKAGLFKEGRKLVLEYLIRDKALIEKSIEEPKALGDRALGIW